MKTRKITQNIPKIFFKSNTNKILLQNHISQNNLYKFFSHFKENDSGEIQ